MDGNKQAEPVKTDWERIARVQDAKLRAMCNEPKAFENLCKVLDMYEKHHPAVAQEPVGEVVEEKLAPWCPTYASVKWFKTDFEVGTKLYTEAPAVAQDGFSWATGEPPKWFKEWFIAKLDNGQRVVLKRLPEEFTYDYTTADETYYAKRRVAKWMQFPDSEFMNLNEAPAVFKKLTDAQIELGAKKLANLFDYPWEYMPEEGKQEIRGHVQTIFEVVMAAENKGSTA